MNKNPYEGVYIGQRLKFINNPVGSTLRATFKINEWYSVLDIREVSNVTGGKDWCALIGNNTDNIWGGSQMVSIDPNHRVYYKKAFTSLEEIREDSLSQILKNY